MMKLRKVFKIALVYNEKKGIRIFWTYRCAVKVARTAFKISKDKYIIQLKQILRAKKKQSLCLLTHFFSLKKKNEENSYYT